MIHYLSPYIDLATLVALATIIAVLTVVLALMDLAAESWANPLDLRVSKVVIRHRSIGETRLMHWASWLGGPYGIALTVLCFIGLQSLYGHYLTAFLFSSTVAASVFYVLLVKVLTARKRPKLKMLEIERTFSFPSAHSLVSTATYLSLGFLLYQASGNLILVLVGVILALLVIGFSRVYLGCHYLSDVVAGFAAGAVWAGIFLYLHLLIA